MRTTALLATAIVLGACGEPTPPEPPRPPRVSAGHCRFTSLEANDATSMRVGVLTMNDSDNPLSASGELEVGIYFSMPNREPGSVAPFVCSGNVRLDANTSFAGDAPGVATVNVALAPACPPPPAGAIVLVRGSVQRDGATQPAGCNHTLATPAVFGGGGLDYEEQARARDRAAVATSADFAVMRTYADRLQAVLATLPAAAANVERPCALPTDAAGPTLVATAETLASIASPNEAALRPPPALHPFGGDAPLDSPALTALGQLLHEGHGDASSVRAWIEAHSPYVAIVQTRSIRMPEEHGGSQERTHTYTPGLFEGVVSLADTRTAQLLCARRFESTSTGDFTQRTRYEPSLSGQLRSAFAGANLQATLEARRAMAPSLGDDLRVWPTR